MGITINEIVQRWTGPFRPKFATGKLWDEVSQCGCAQGDILRQCGILPQDFPEQTVADREIAKRLGISLFHSILLRVVNDSQQGCPERVLQFTDAGLGSVLGPNWRVVMAFGEHIDGIPDVVWTAVKNAMPFSRAAVAAAAADAAQRLAAWESSARKVAGEAAWVAARKVARDAIGEVVWDPTGDAALVSRGAAWECIGISQIAAPALFLPILGITDVAEFARLANLRWRE